MGTKICGSSGRAKDLLQEVSDDFWAQMADDYRVLSHLIDPHVDPRERFFKSDNLYDEHPLDESRLDYREDWSYHSHNNHKRPQYYYMGKPICNTCGKSYVNTGSGLNCPLCQQDEINSMFDEIDYEMGSWDIYMNPDYPI
jgi:hypothetical protein